MTRHLVLLRGIKVGGRNKVLMAALRRLRPPLAEIWETAEAARETPGLRVSRLQLRRPVQQTITRLKE